MLLLMSCRWLGVHFHIFVNWNGHDCLVHVFIYFYACQKGLGGSLRYTLVLSDS
jgi:hypothetical protein